MAESVVVYCPRCGRKVGTYDGKSSINFVTKCVKCQKQVVYDIKTKETRIKPLPKRQTSSGVTF